MFALRLLGGTFVVKSCVLNEVLARVADGALKRISYRCLATPS